jgi:hypothetical protein
MHALLAWAEQHGAVFPKVAPSAANERRLVAAADVEPNCESRRRLRPWCLLTLGQHMQLRVYSSPLAV